MAIIAKQAYFISPPIVTSGLVMLLDARDSTSYPGSGTNWANLVASNITNTLINNPAYSTSVGGNLAFDGTNQYVSSTGASIGTAHSFELWLRNQTTSTSTWIGYSPDTSTRYFEYNASTVSFTLNNSTVTIPNIPVQQNQWHHAVFTKDGSNYTLYINGISVVNGTQLAWSVLGIAFDQISRAGSTYAQGALSSMKIYERALSIEEVTQNYNAHKARFGLL